jgi:hypothetical protein
VDTENLKVIGVQRVSDIAPDGELLFKFELEAREPITLRFKLGAFDEFASEANQFLAQVCAYKLSIGEGYVVNAMPVSSGFSDVVTSDGEVLLGLSVSDTALLFFTMTPELAEKLQRQLGRAAKSGKARRTKSRH